MRTSDEYNPADDGNENSGKAPPSQAAECDIGLALNMQHTETTHPSEKMNFMSSNTSLYHHPQHRASFDFGGGGGGGGSGGGRLLFGSYSTANSNQTAYGTSFINTTGVDAQKMVFTASQLQEFENQTMIYKHIMSSNPIPPQLLLPLSTQYNRSDSEPWRCRRTDGKKWRCSRDVMPDQKYCERHAHKNRPRSRKPVETQNTKNHNTKDNYHSIPPPATGMPTSCQQSRCTDQWFMRGGTIPLSSSHQKIQKAMAAPSVGSKSDNFFQNLDGSYQDLVEGDSCSLSLMQPGGDYSTCADQDFFQMGTRMLSEDGSNPRDQVVHQGSWLGGPLGEALCPGVVSSLNQPTNVSSPNDSSHELC